MFIGKIVKIFEKKLANFPTYKEAMIRSNIRPMEFDEHALMICTQMHGIQISPIGEDAPIKERAVQMYFCCTTLANFESYKSDEFILTWDHAITSKARNIIEPLIDENIFNITKTYSSFDILDYVPAITVDTYRNVTGEMESSIYTFEEYTDLFNDPSTMLRAVALCKYDSYKDSISEKLFGTNMNFTDSTIIFLPVDIDTDVITLKTKDNELHIFLRKDKESTHAI